MKRLILISTLFVAQLFLGSLNAQSYLQERVEAKGHLFIHGGAPMNDQMAKDFIAVAPKGKINAVIIPYASPSEKSSEAMKSYLLKHGVASCTIISLENPEVDSPENLKLLSEATMVYFTGGSQKKLARRMGKSELLKKVKELYKSGGAVGGTSAGASIMGRLMPTGIEFGTTDPKKKFTTIEQGKIEVIEGFGMVQNFIIDQHFLIRKRANRLFSVILDNPTQRGIGIDEPAAIMVKPNSSFEVLGDGKVLVYEPLNLTTPNEAPAILVKILSPGDIYKF
ncbi:MAG: cyanophycinase [Bacteroidales bacterium]